MTTRLYELVDQAVEQTTQVIKRIADEVWQFAELSLQEIKSAQLIINILQEQGFTITSTGTALCLTTLTRDETSFRASRVAHRRCIESIRQKLKSSFIVSEIVASYGG